MKSRILITVLIFVIVGLFASCNSAPEPYIAPDKTLMKYSNGSAWHGAVYHVTIDGMDCIYISTYHRGGLTCDWSMKER